jgi:hypothetical protein
MEPKRLGMARADCELLSDPSREDSIRLLLQRQPFVSCLTGFGL